MSGFLCKHYWPIILHLIELTSDHSMRHHWTVVPLAEKELQLSLECTVRLTTAKNMFALIHITITFRSIWWWILPQKAGKLLLLKPVLLQSCKSNLWLVLLEANKSIIHTFKHTNSNFDRIFSTFSAPHSNVWVESLQQPLTGSHLCFFLYVK